LTLEPLKYFLNECFWINRRETDALCRNKPYQLHMAKEEGFKIPKGIISNNSNDVQKRISGFKQVVYKPLSYYIVPPDRILYSSIMTKDEVKQKSQNIEQAPCIFQEYIDKDFELRITIVGKKVFPIKIQSQQNHATKFDWRKDQINVDYEIFDLPDKIEQKLLHLHQKFEVFFGAYDFIVDPQGEYYFLEVNPAGQWLWMEEALNLNISECIAEALINK
jgi:glutathione synthase/RimK-type ligase-like ATP-grasp enzyme